MAYPMPLREMGSAHLLPIATPTSVDQSTHLPVRRWASQGHHLLYCAAAHLIVNCQAGSVVGPITCPTMLISWERRCH